MHGYELNYCILKRGWKDSEQVSRISCFDYLQCYKVVMDNGQYTASSA